MPEENNEKLDKSIDWEKTALLTDSDEADAIGKDGSKYRITTDGPWPIGNVEKGEELAKQGKHEEAIVYYDAAIKADKIIADGEEDNESAKLQYYKAESLIALGRDEEAKQCVDRAEELEPYGYPQPPLPQGMELAKRGKHEKAIEVYTAEIESGKKIRCNENTLLQYYKAESLTELGRDEEAKQCIDRAKELDPNWQPPSKPENK